MDDEDEDYNDSNADDYSLLLLIIRFFLCKTHLFRKKQYTNEHISTISVSSSGSV